MFIIAFGGELLISHCVCSFTGIFIENLSKIPKWSLPKLSI